MTATDVQKILHLRHAWKFVMDKDVVSSPTDYSILCHIAQLVNEGFHAYGGRIRGVPVTIGGTSYVPPLPIEQLEDILQIKAEPIDVAIQLCLYRMKTQIFNDGSNRAAVIFSSHYLIAKGGGLLVIPESHVPEFKRLLVSDYGGRDDGSISTFMRENAGKLSKVIGDFFRKTCANNSLYSVLHLLCQRREFASLCPDEGGCFCYDKCNY